MKTVMKSQLILSGYQAGFHVAGPRRGVSGMLSVSEDWQVRVFRICGIIDRPADHLQIRSITLYECMYS